MLVLLLLFHSRILYVPGVILSPQMPMLLKTAGTVVTGFLYFVLM